MAVFTPDKEPRYYSTTQTINWSADSNVSQVASSINALPPAISEYIAYDTLSPPNPFLAVTQDGKGNVVYDGGFPKFYDNRLPATLPTTFSEMEGGHKFLYNALNFVANPIKVAAGNRNILVVGNANTAESYSVKNSGGSNFRTSLEMVADIAGYTFTIKDRDDWGGVINFTLSELDSYCAVICMGTRGGNTRGDVTETAISEIVTYRELGNGLIFITDHGPEVPDINTAATLDGGFFDWVNRITVNFGAYFTGDYDRTPVNVGFLRSTYGDHPLYNNMLDSEDITAQGSESRVVVTEVTTYGPAEIPPTVLDTPGKHEVNFLAIKDDGSVVTERYAFTVVEGEFVYPGRLDGQLPTSRGLNTFRSIGDVHIKNLDTDLGTLLGRIYIDGVFTGTFQTNEDEGTIYQWAIPGSTGFPVYDSVDVTFEIDAPVRYKSIHALSVSTLPLTSTLNTAQVLPVLSTQDAQGLSRDALIDELMIYTRRHFGGDGKSLASMVQLLAQEQARIKGTGSVPYPTVTVHTVPTQADLDAEMELVPNDVWCILSEDGNVFGVYDPVVEQWTLNGISDLAKILPYPCRVVSSTTAATFTFNGTGLQ